MFKYFLPQGFQLTGFFACCNRYGLDSFIKLFSLFIKISELHEIKKWDEIVHELRIFIKNYLENNKISETLVKKEKADIKLDNTSEKIISILDEYIKPAVSSDGGNILFDSYDSEKKLVKVILQGACSGCPSSTITLKNGIENMLKEMLQGQVETVEAING